MRKALIVLLLAGAGCQEYRSESGGYQLYRSRTYNPPSTSRYEDLPDTSSGPLHQGDPEAANLFDAYTTFQP